MDSNWDKKKKNPTAKPKVNGPVPPKKVSPKKICFKCKQETGPGIRHPCTPNAAKRNIAEMIAKETTTGQEQILYESLKNIVHEEGGDPGNEVRFTGLRGGNPLGVTVGQSPGKLNPQLVTPEFMAGLQKKLGCSEKKILTIAREFRTKGVKFEDHIREDLDRLSHSLDAFYMVETLEFEEKKGKNSKVTKVMLDLVHLKDPVKFIEHVITDRGLDKSKVLVRVGLDGGQGSFKVVVSIFETDYDPEITFSKNEGQGTRLTGSSRLLDMALAEDMQELYENLRIIVEKLRLNEIDCCFTSDLKLINAILGISSHSGKHACAYCEGEMTLESGTMRTFKSLDNCYANFEAGGLNYKNMQHFGNVIHKSLITGDPDVTILTTIPLPELHLLMGLVNWALELLYNVMEKDKLQEWMRKKGISVHGYHGGGLDGGNSNLFLKHLNFLSQSAPAETQQIFEMLSVFKTVVQGCFGIDLSLNFKEDIDQFILSMINLIKYSKNKLGINLNPTWKVHILVCHLKDFLVDKQVDSI
jgi:hypothetical protein